MIKHLSFLVVILLTTSCMSFGDRYKYPYEKGNAWRAVIEKYNISESDIKRQHISTVFDEIGSDGLHTIVLQVIINLDNKEIIEYVPVIHGRSVFIFAEKMKYSFQQGEFLKPTVLVQ